MLRPAAGNDEQRVDPQVIALANEARRKPLGGGRHPPQPVMVKREAGGIGGSAGLHFDEGNDPAAPSDDVDFAARHPRPPSEDSPAAEPQIPAGERLGAAPALFGGVAVHLERSTARA